MNDNVIIFPKNNEFKCNSLDNDLAKADTRHKYLSVLKEYLTTEDYESILLGIMDSEYYDDLEDQLQDIVNCYFKYKK